MIGIVKLIKASVVKYNLIPLSLIKVLLSILMNLVLVFPCRCGLFRGRYILILPNLKILIVEPVDFFIIRELLLNHAYDIIPKRILDKYKGNILLVDIGSHIGVYSLMYAHITKHIICIEPCPRNLMLLKYNFKLNKMLRFTKILMCAIWKTRGIVEFTIRPHAPFTSHITLAIDSASNETKITVPSMRVTEIKKYMANLLEDTKLMIIKVDIEGAEKEITDDLLTFITEFNKPVFMLLEVHDNVTKKLILRKLRTLGALAKSYSKFYKLNKRHVKLDYVAVFFKPPTKYSSNRMSINNI